MRGADRKNARLKSKSGHSSRSTVAETTTAVLLLQHVRDNFIRLWEKDIANLSGHV